MNVRQEVLTMSLWALLWGVSGHVSAQGQVNITGNILSNTCTVSAGDVNKTVALGSVAGKQFTSVGSVSQAIPFSLTLENCGPSASGVAVTFTGAADVNNGQLLATEGGNGTASGVGVAVLDSAHKLIPLNSASPVYGLVPGQTTSVLQLYAEYMSVESGVTAGAANASATFQLTYA